jgi:hypothetical protein
VVEGLEEGVRGDHASLQAAWWDESAAEERAIVWIMPPVLAGWSPAPPRWRSRGCLAGVVTVWRAVGGRALEVEGAVGPVEGDGAVRSQHEGPATLMDEVVVNRAERDQVVQVRAAVAFPPVNVVDATGVEGDLAARVGAGAVHRPQRAPLGSVGETLLAADVQDFAVAAEHDRDEVGVTAEATDRVGRQGAAVGGLTHRVVVQPRLQRVEVDQHRHFWDPPLQGPCSGDQPDRRVDLKLLPGGVGVLGCGSFGGRCRRQGSGNLGVGLGVKFQQCLAHPRFAVDPPPQPAPALLLGEPGAS